jgi:hypothetical protein
MELIVERIVAFGQPYLPLPCIRAARAGGLQGDRRAVELVCASRERSLQSPSVEREGPVSAKTEQQRRPVWLQAPSSIFRVGGGPATSGSGTAVDAAPLADSCISLSAVSPPQAVSTNASAATFTAEPALIRLILV